MPLDGEENLTLSPYRSEDFYLWDPFQEFLTLRVMIILLFGP